MNDISEGVLRILGFNKIIVNPEEAGNDVGYYYFTFEINDKCLLISNSNDEADNGHYSVEFFQHEGLSTTNSVDLIDLIRVLKKMVK